MNGNRAVLLWLLTTLLALLALAAAWFPEATHDYRYYLWHWDLIMSGGNPWTDRNPVSFYGPVYNLLALPYSLHRHLPRVLGALCWIALGTLFTRRLFDSAYPAAEKAIVWLVLWANPLVWILGYWSGTNDMFMAPLTGAAVVLLMARRDGAAGVVFALAAMVKFLPVFVLPFLAVSRREIRWKFVLAFVGALSVGYLAAYSIWGADVFAPFFGGVSRPSTMMSIFRFLRGPYSPIPGGIDSAAVPLMLVSLAALWVLHIRRDFNPMESAFLGLLITLLWYHVGHLQFYLTPLAVGVACYLAPGSTLRRHRLALLVFFGWLAGVSVVYQWTDYMMHFPSRTRLIGLPHFLLLGGLIVVLLRTMLRERGSGDAAGGRSADPVVNE